MCQSPIYFVHERTAAAPCSDLTRGDTHEPFKVPPNCLRWLAFCVPLQNFEGSTTDWWFSDSIAWEGMSSHAPSIVNHVLKISRGLTLLMLSQLLPQWGFFCLVCYTLITPDHCTLIHNAAHNRLWSRWPCTVSRIAVSLTYLTNSGVLSGLLLSDRFNNQFQLTATVNGQSVQKAAKVANIVRCLRLTWEGNSKYVTKFHLGS